VVVSLLTLPSISQREGLHIPVGNTLIAACFPDSVFCSKIRHLD